MVCLVTDSQVAVHVLISADSVEDSVISAVRGRYSTVHNIATCIISTAQNENVRMSTYQCSEVSSQLYSNEWVRASALKPGRT